MNDLATPPSPAHETIYFDGACGLCHALVRFTAKHDAAGWFDFAPLGGEHFRAAVPHPPSPLPDSAMVRTSEGPLLLRSAAVLHVLRRLGGGWRAVANIVGVLPRPLLDWGYGIVARLRRRLFALPANACPMVPSALRSRFHS